VDLSEAQIKKSESIAVPLSSRAGANNAIAKSKHEYTNNLDCTLSKPRFGVTIKRGNFRRTQEDRVRNFKIVSFG
jgi:hypothetical protein